ncbi:non-repetitive/WGA-negative nucleoporin [Xylariales sp. AK1849]|nr:non-repetitive/WGA-negative nucleoporin [Xylariales sp. AK1849]
MSFTQATPMRPVPGAFMNTPAVASRFAASSDPVRRQLFKDQTQAGSSSQAPVPTGLGPQGFDAPTEPGHGQALQPLGGGGSNQLPPPPPQSPLTKGAGYINNALAGDEMFPELEQYCKQPSSEYHIPGFGTAWAPYKMAHLYTIPPIVFDQYQRAEVSTMMGLFAELNHAWVTVDNCLYLWDYTHPNPELTGYEDNDQSITAVKLVAPKPGVFVKDINYMLVVSTTSDMFLLGVAAQPSATGAMAVTLYQTRMQLSLRGSEARVIAGAKNGRIFFAGQSDCDIYELYYQQEEKWFSSRTGKINHSSAGWTSVVPKTPQILWGTKNTEYIVDIVIDDSRNLLYSLSNTSTIRTYHMEAPDKLTKLIEKTKDDCLRDVMHMLSNASTLLNGQMTIVSICPVTKFEDHKVHLIAVTNTGCRLFMSAAGASYMRTTSSRIPESMQLHSIKFPPTNLPRSQRPSYGGAAEWCDTNSNSLQTTRKSARFAPGYFVAFVVKDGQDTLFVSTPDTGRIKNQHSNTQSMRYYEQCNWIEIGNNVRAEDIGLISQPFAATSQPAGFANELAVQFDQPASEFAVLSNEGIYIIRRRRLVDIFASAVRGSVGDEGLKSTFNQFQNLYGRVETVTAALAVACGQGNDQAIGVGRSAMDQGMEDKARQAFVNFGGNPMLPEQDGQQPTVESVRPSSRHAALSLYLSRLVRTLWSSPVIQLGADAAGALAINSYIPVSKLLSVQESLERLRTFLDHNKSFIQGLSGPADLQRAASKQEELAFQGEHQALHALQVLMAGISEGISFVQMLFDERVADIYTRLDEDSRQQLRNLSYERLFSQISGKDLAKVLVKAIVNRNIESGSNVETVADALRRRCGSFCSPDDVVIFRAQEQVKRASEPAINANTSRTLLGESLRLFQKVAGSLTHANLEHAVNQYLGMRYYAGAIQLCLTVAQEKDRGNAALAWINDKKPANDQRSNKFAERKRCYDLIHLILQNLDTASSREPEMIDGKRTSIAIKRDEAYDVVNNSTDEVFHNDLYEWYVEQGWTDRLLSIESPHVVSFLQSLATSNVVHADLLCRFFTMRNRFYEAAQVQAQLAQSDFQISIKDRLKLLSRAKTNVSVMTAGVGRQELQMLNHEVTELLEVAHIQDDLLERLKVDPRIPDERRAEVEQTLDGQIQGLSELFNSYADQAGYYDLCLLIYHAADFRNPTTIEQTWVNLIAQTHDEIQSQWDLYHAGRRNRTASVEAPPQPYEKVIGVIQDVCHRASNDSFIFPVATLLPDVCRYAVENNQDGWIGADPNWPITVFLQLGVSHDLVTRVLEQMFQSQDRPFRNNAGRMRVVEWITFVVRNWVREVARSGRPERGLESWVSELMHECAGKIPHEASQERSGSGTPEADIKRDVAEVTKALDALTGAGHGSFRGSMGFL